MPVLNPWLALGFLAAMCGCFASGAAYGHRAEKKEWVLAIAEQKITAANALAQSEAARVEMERVFYEFKSKVELEHAAREGRIDTAYGANRKLLAHLGGLYDAKGTVGGACRRDKVSADAESSYVNSGTAAGCGLSAETSEALLDLARDADRAASYAQACHQWALSIGRIDAPVR
jgi:hypothetical protein